MDDLGGTICFLMQIGNSTAELQPIITDFFQRTGVCKIDKSSATCATSRTTSTSQKAARLYFEIVFVQPHNPTTFHLKVNEFSFVKVGIHTIKVHVAVAQPPHSRRTAAGESFVRALILARKIIRSAPLLRSPQVQPTKRVYDMNN